MIENYQEECRLLYSLMTSGQWDISFYQEDPSMSDEYNYEHQWEIKRLVVPFSGKSGDRRWYGPSLAIAYHNALKDIKS